MALLLTRSARGKQPAGPTLCILVDVHFYNDCTNLSLALAGCVINANPSIVMSSESFFIGSAAKKKVRWCMYTRLFAVNVLATTTSTTTTRVDGWMDDSIPHVCVCMCRDDRGAPKHYYNT
jgi:hypothetical protein